MNPMVAFTAGYRYALFGSALDPPELSGGFFQFSLASAFAAGVVMWLVAGPLFRRLSRSFADEL